MKKQLLLATIGLALSLSIVGCSQSSKTSDNSASKKDSVVETTMAETEAPTEAVPDYYEIGTPMKLKDWSITVTKAEFVDKISDNDFFAFTPDEGSKYMLVDATIQNDGKQADTFLSYVDIGDNVSTKIIYQDGYEFIASNLLGYEKDLHAQTINPLESKSGSIAFSIPNSVVDSSDPLFVLFESGSDTLKIKLR